MAFPDKSTLSDEGKALVDLIKSAKKVHRDTSNMPPNISANEMRDEIGRKQKNMDVKLGEFFGYATNQGWRHGKFVKGTRYEITLWHSDDDVEVGGATHAVAPSVGPTATEAVAEKRGPGRPRKVLTPADVNAPTTPGLHVEGEELGDS